MDSDIGNREIRYYADDGEYRKYCDNCDNFCIDRWYKNHLESGTHINNVHKRQWLNNTYTNK